MRHFLNTNNQLTVKCCRNWNKHSNQNDISIKVDTLHHTSLEKTPSTLKSRLSVMTSLFSVRYQTTTRALGESFCAMDELNVTSTVFSSDAFSRRMYFDKINIPLLRTCKYNRDVNTQFSYGHCPHGRTSEIAEATIDPGLIISL